MTAAHVMQAVSIEQHRADWMADYNAEGNRHGSAVREQARTLWPLYLHWQMITGQSLRSVFLRWLTGEETPSMTYYQRLNAGRALASGLDFDLPAYQLATLGRALDRQTAGEVQARLETPGGLEAMAAEQKRQDGTVTLPTSELPAVRQIVQEVSDREGLAAPEALALVIQAHEALPLTIQRAAIESAKTGVKLEDAARQIVAKMLDPRAFLASMPCAICGMTPVELHHLRLPDLPDTPGLRRFKDKSNELLLPICSYHHRNALESAHQIGQEEWSQIHFGHPYMAFFLAARYMGSFIYNEDFS